MHSDLNSLFFQTWKELSADHQNSEWYFLHRTWIQKAYKVFYPGKISKPNWKLITTITQEI